MEILGAKDEDLKVGAFNCGSDCGDNGRDGDDDIDGDGEGDNDGDEKNDELMGSAEDDGLDDDDAGSSACELEDNGEESVLEDIREAFLECESLFFKADWDSTLEVLEADENDELEEGPEERKD